MLQGQIFGDIVYYTPEKTTFSSTDADGNITETSSIVSSLFDEGIYYIKRIDSNNIKLAKSRSNIQNLKFLLIDNATIANFNKIELEEQIDDDKIEKVFTIVNSILINKKRYNSRQYKVVYEIQNILADNNNIKNVNYQDK